jgi:hypothetical protein
VLAVLSRRQLHAGAVGVLQGTTEALTPE